MAKVLLLPDQQVLSYLVLGADIEYPWRLGMMGIQRRKEACRTLPERPLEAFSGVAIRSLVSVECLTWPLVSWE